MSTVAEQLLTLLAVLVGAAASTAGAVLAERFRWRRDYQRRWDAKRLDAITAYAAAVKMEARLCLRVAASTWPEATSNPLAIDDGQAQIAAAEDRRSEAFEPLLLLADAATVRAAREWQGAVWRLHAIVTDPPPDLDAGGFLELFNASGAARERFYDAARTSLEVISDRHRPGAWSGSVSQRAEGASKVSAEA